jgi:hypothetical protein
MKTIFGLFESYQEAQTITRELLDQNFPIEEMNVIIQEKVAKEDMQVSLEKANVAVTDEIGEQTLQGLDRLLGGQQPVTLPVLEDVYAAGKLATILAKTAAAPGAADGGLKAALIDFNVPEETAQAYSEGIEQGGLLFWLRTSDDRASEATNILNKQAQHIISPID